MSNTIQSLIQAKKNLIEHNGNLDLQRDDLMICLELCVEVIKELQQLQTKLDDMDKDDPKYLETKNKIVSMTESFRKAFYE